MNNEIRNIAIIAHVDHGKTTLLDKLLESTNMTASGFSMDSNTLEKERGITIYAKNTSVLYKNTKINVLDTPGHADFSSEVERVLKAVDAVLLLVDAKEGTMPQTRFVLSKALQLGLLPIVIINKIDKDGARPHEVYDEVLELFIELGANDKQLDFPVIYASGRDGWAKLDINDEQQPLTLILDKIIEIIPNSSTNVDADFKAQVFNLAYDSFLGRLAICRIYSGKMSDKDEIFCIKKTGEKKNKITKLFTFEGMSKIAISEALSGDIIMLAGIPDVFIGDTITNKPGLTAMPEIKIDEPTVKLNLLPNDSPFAGKSGKFLTTREIKERLLKELEVNVGLLVNMSDDKFFEISGRGELHLSVLLETMRREGFEFQVSSPEAIIKKDDNGDLIEPFEEVVADVPTIYSGSVIEKLTKRKAIVTHMHELAPFTKIVLEMPTRGLLGYKNQFIVDTKGEGIIASRFIDFKPFAGEIKMRETGSMVSMESGKALAFALANLQQRGRLYIEHAQEVYEGMVIGNTSAGGDMSVNPTKGKQLTNMRASGTDEAIRLEPFLKLDIEKGLEIMSEDEYLEITPDAVRLRKKLLTELDRARSRRAN